MLLPQNAAWRSEGARMHAQLEEVIDALLALPPTSTLRLQKLADLMKVLLVEAGLPSAKGGSGGELTVPGLARPKNWDVAFEFAGKFRLLISLKSMLRNISGAVPNRIDDLQGELANVQQLRPEIVIGYVILLDISEDSRRTQDGSTWSDFFEQCLQRIAIRRAPLWNQGLMEGLWFIRFDRRKPIMERLVEPAKVVADGEAFIHALLRELKLREPAIPFNKEIP